MDHCVLIMAGGTGGHVFPALAIAEQLRKAGQKVVWLGTKQGLESEVVPKVGIAMEWISIQGLRGKGYVSWLTAPLTLVRAFWQVNRILRRIKPNVVVGMGGFVSGPGAVISWLRGIPVVIHEQNAIPGLTNRLVSPIATQIMEAFPGSFRASTKLQHIGNPVRAEIMALATPQKRLAKHQGPLRLLVLGGSLGARRLNETVPVAVANIALDLRPTLWHQTGRHHLQATQDLYQKSGVTGRVVPFIEDMAGAYGWSDLVLCRAGAMTISELMVAGVGSILVPYPFAVDDHQRHNAEFLVTAGAGHHIADQELDATRLENVLRPYLQDRTKLKAMALAARKLAKPEAAQRAAQLCQKAAQ